MQKTLANSKLMDKHNFDNPYTPPNINSQPVAEDLVEFFRNAHFEAKIVFTLEHLVEAIRRYRSQRPLARYLKLFVRMAAILLVPIAIVSLFTQASIAGILLIAFMVFALCSERCEFWYIRRQNRAHPYLNVDILITMTNAQFATSSVRGESRHDWSIFSQLVLFDEGALLLHGPSQLHWIPYNSLTQNRSYLQFAEFLKWKIGRYREIS